jgi:hypothetical protein
MGVSQLLLLTVLFEGFQLVVHAQQTKSRARRSLEKGFGLAEGSAVSLRDDPGGKTGGMGGAPGKMPTCSFKYKPLPSRLDTALPQLVDVFAEQSANQVYFVGLNQNQCLEAPELKHGWDPSNGYPTQFYGKVYECLFSTSVAGLVLGHTTSDQIASDSDGMVFHCAIPEKLRKFAMNKADRASLVVTVRHTEKMNAGSGPRPTDAWENLPVCANPIVNKRKVLYPPKKHYLSACLYATGDPYWAIQVRQRLCMKR